MIVCPSFLLQATTGFGSPEAAQVSFKFSLSCKITGLVPPTPLLLMVGGISSLSSLLQAPATFQAHTPDSPCSPCNPSAPDRPLGPGRPRSPLGPTGPLEPVSPLSPCFPFVPGTPAVPGVPGMPSSAPD